VLDCPAEVVVKRVAGRRTCSRCGAVYNLSFNPPEDGRLCDLDGCGLSQRPDDNEDTIRERLKVYREQTTPIIDYYAGRQLIHHVDAAQGIEDVRNDVIRKLGLEEAQ
jgi:adenylate kinase